MPGQAPTRIVSVSPNEGIFQVRERDVGVELHCQAEGNPPPSITFERGNKILTLLYRTMNHETNILHN